MGDDKLDILEDIIDKCSKEIKGEKENIRQVLLTLFSAFTENPQNLRILAPSGEGKTYLVTKLTELFPQENVIILSHATPQSFRYAMKSRKVVENGPNSWQELQIAIGPLEEELKKTKDPEEREKLTIQIKTLKESVYDEIDFTNKIIVFADSQSFELFESLKTTLSHDQKVMRSFSVNKTSSGMLKGQRFIVKGFPAVIYCSAKDEQRRDETNEISTRFNTISLNTDKKKYRQMLNLEGLRSSLPKLMYENKVVSEEEIERIQAQIIEIIERIKKQEEIFNAYGLGVAKRFPDDGGYRTRQLKILNSNIRMHTLVNSIQRPKIIFDEKSNAITIWDDVIQAVKLTKQAKEIQPYKIKQFNEYIRPIILESGIEKDLGNERIKCLTASEILEMMSLHGLEIDRQKLQETILKPLAQHGYLEEFQDPENKTRHVYALNKQFVNTKATLESTLIDVSSFDMSCVNVFMDENLKQRFDMNNLTIHDKDNKEISLEELTNILTKIDVSDVQNTNKTGNVDSSINIEGEEDGLRD